MKINILGYEYTVSRGCFHNEDTGYINHNDCTITIDDSLSPEASAETILHEIFHGIEYANRLTWAEDDIWRMARGIFAVLRANPQLVAAIMLEVCNEPEDLELDL